MNFGFRDIMIIMSMSVMVISMNFVFPALGLASDQTSESDIPEFNITTDRFGGYLDKPEFPSTPNRGTINHTSTKFDNYAGSIQVELGKGTSGEKVWLVAIEENETHLTNESASIDNEIFSSNDVTKRVQLDGYTVDVHSVDISTGEYTYEVVSRPGDSTWYSSIPFIGGIFSAGEQLAGIIGWIGSLLFYFLIGLGSTILNGFVIMFDFVTFAVGLLHWLITTYTGIIANAPTSWASLILAIPGILLSLEFSKVILIIVSLLPFT